MKLTGNITFMVIKGMIISIILSSGFPPGGKGI